MAFVTKMPEKHRYASPSAVTIVTLGRGSLECHCAPIKGVGSDVHEHLYRPELPVPCVTVCHHISTGLYHSLSAQRLSERTVYTIQIYHTDPYLHLVV
jgi:hypothetical protein